MRVSSRTIAFAAGSLLSLACARQRVVDGSAPVAMENEPSYAESIARIAIRQSVDDSVAVAGGRSILMTHGARAPRVYVLLHGFSDAPTQFATVGAHLFDDGDNVYIPRLPHHAERSAPLRALARVRAEELASFGDSTADIARGLGDTIIVVGLSAGGVIAGWIAQTHATVHRAVLIAPAIAPGGLSDDQGAGLVVLASTLPDIQRARARDSSRLENVPGITTRGLAELLRLGRRVYDAADNKPSGARNVVFLLNALDHTVSEDASVDLAQRWFDRGAAVSVYRFGAAAKLPHNVMELTERGGNVEVVYPVVEALARAATAPPTVRLLGVPCHGFWCAVRRWTNTHS
jgi:pimeloyl-ACP methyl ester carboxylesterase